MLIRKPNADGSAGGDPWTDPAILVSGVDLVLRPGTPPMNGTYRVEITAGPTTTGGTKLKFNVYEDLVVHVEPGFPGDVPERAITVPGQTLTFTFDGIRRSWAPGFWRIVEVTITNQSLA